ncbi:MAG: CRTAC1 family protein [Planctomycetaceae bacterium]|nr:MAG: CRTAC1 family protein [Planctomycetaceae bacterium]
MGILSVTPSKGWRTASVTNLPSDRATFVDRQRTAALRLSLLLGGALVLGLGGCDSNRSESSRPASAPEPQGQPKVKSQPEGAKSQPRHEHGEPSAAMPRGPLRFTEVTADTGIDFVHVSGDFAEKPFPAANGSGVAAFDFDLDGYADLYFATGSQATFDRNCQIHPTNECYRNRGDWQFEKITSAAGLEFRGYSAGVAVGDFNSDGFPDLFVNCYGADGLFRNQGDGTFVDVSRQGGVADDPYWGTSAAFLDYDGDGLLDLYVANYAVWSMEVNRYCGDRVRGVRTFCAPSTVEPAPHVLYRNSGDGTLTVDTAQANLSGLSGRGQGVLAADFDDDGHVDLYVANDLNPNFLLVGDGAGKFIDRSKASGTDTDYLGIAQAGMGIAIADANRDGLIDLFVTNYEGEHNAYYENQGGLLFQDVSRSRGLAADSIPWVGWGTVLADFDLDGWPDCLVTNGHTDNNFEQMGRDSPYAQRPGIWHNTHGRFRWAGGAAAGPYFAAKHVGRGLATADFDGDGDLDVVIVHQDGPPALLRNDVLPEERGNRQTVSVGLIGRRGNRDAIGATVRELGCSPERMWSVTSGGSYASASERRVLISRLAAESGEPEKNVSVRWPGGRVTEHRVPAGSTAITILEPLTE